MRIKGKRVLKNGAIAGYVKQSDGSWKWRIISGPKKGGFNINNIPSNLPNVNDEETLKKILWERYTIRKKINNGTINKIKTVNNIINSANPEYKNRINSNSNKLGKKILNIIKKYPWIYKLDYSSMNKYSNKEELYKSIFPKEPDTPKEPNTPYENANAKARANAKANAKKKMKNKITKNINTLTNKLYKKGEKGILNSKFGIRGYKWYSERLQKYKNSLFKERNPNKINKINKAQKYISLLEKTHKRVKKSLNKKKDQKLRNEINDLLKEIKENIKNYYTM